MRVTKGAVGSGGVGTTTGPAQTLHCKIRRHRRGGWFRQILPIYESVKPSSPDHKTLADQSCGVPGRLGAPVQI